MKYQFTPFSVTGSERYIYIYITHSFIHTRIRLQRLEPRAAIMSFLEGYEMFLLVNIQLQGMEQELIGVPSSYRNAMSTRLRLFRRDLGKLQREVKSSDQSSSSSTRPAEGAYGIYSSQNEHSTQLQSQRALLIQGHEHLNNASQSIERSQRIAAETDQIGVDIIEELGEQREQLDRTRDRLVNTGENLSRSRKILRAMSRRLMTNKLLLSVIILMELVILGAVVYLKFFRK
uniref:Vesicle transport through interaction with t-SNAREs 1B n=2 Tax=Oncorhynchus kisutch TaxID=8019 RepID=A0A8C7D5I1_ONCKI